MNSLIQRKKEVYKRAKKIKDENGEERVTYIINNALLSKIENNPNYFNIEKTDTTIAYSYKLDISYDNLVDDLIRERYSISQEFAILRQRDTKPEEFAEYNAYAEQCKVRARELLSENEN